MSVSRRLFASIVCMFALVQAGAQTAQAPAQQPSKKVPVARTEVVDGERKLHIVDLSPRFLDFYQAALGKDPETRWNLWNEKYGFAAVPPTPEGMQMARQMLDEAWPHYADALPMIRKGVAAMEPRPEAVLAKVASLLGLEGPFEMQVTAYVGAFDGNAFTAAQGHLPMVAVPLEMDAGQRALVFPHEMTHAVHIATAKLSGGWERSIAETIMQEGLAMHVAQTVVPGRDVRDYIEHKPGWYDAAMAKSDAILRGLQPDLEKSDSPTVFRYTMGTGNTGTEREAYVAGWLVVGQLLKEGKSFREIARIPSAAMASVVRSTIDRMLPKKS
jgi:Predicted Zn-dependent protease (DUF2268)